MAEGLGGWETLARRRQELLTGDLRASLPKLEVVADPRRPPRWGDFATFDARGFFGAGGT